jgi:hypothetical protein
MADQHGDTSAFEDDGGLQSLEPAIDLNDPEVQAAADPLAEYIAAQAQRRLEQAQAEQHPEVQAQRARDEAAEHAMAAYAEDLAGDYPELQNPESAQRLVAATNRVAVELGNADEVLEDPQRYWHLARSVHDAMVAGHSGDDLRRAVASKEFLSDMANYRGEGLGARCLPF